MYLIFVKLDDKTKNAPRREMRFRLNNIGD